MGPDYQPQDEPQHRHQRRGRGAVPAREQGQVPQRVRNMEGLCQDQPYEPWTPTQLPAELYGIVHPASWQTADIRVAHS